MLKTVLKSFNRTIVELKPYGGTEEGNRRETFNRTIVELKREFDHVAGVVRRLLIVLS